MKRILLVLTLAFLASCSEQKKTHEQLATEWVKEFFYKQSGGSATVKSVKMDSLTNNGTEGYFTVIGEERSREKPMSQLLLYFNEDGTLNEKMNTEIYYE